MFFVHSTFAQKGFLSAKNIVVAKKCDPYLFLKGDDLGWGAPALGDDLGWGGEATRGAQGCGGGYPPLGLLERDINPRGKYMG